MCIFIHFPGLSVLAAAMANKGTFNGVEVLSETEWEAMHDKPKEGKLFGAFSTNFTQGGVNIYKQASVGEIGMMDLNEAGCGNGQLFGKLEWIVL